MLFLESDHYTNFQQEHVGATAGYKVWKQVMNKVGAFVNNPTAQSCVDTKITGFEHLMASLLVVLRRQHVIDDLSTYRHATAADAARAAMMPEAQAATVSITAAANAAGAAIIEAESAAAAIAYPQVPQTAQDTVEQAATANATPAIAAQLTPQTLTEEDIMATEVAITMMNLSTRKGGEAAALGDQEDNTLAKLTPPAPIPTVMPVPLPSPHYTGGVTHEELREKLRLAGAYQFIDFICCDKVEQPELHIDKDRACPKMIPLRCTHGDYGNRQLKCPNCGVNQVNIFSALSQSSEAK